MRFSVEVHGCHQLNSELDIHRSLAAAVLGLESRGHPDRDLLRANCQEGCCEGRIEEAETEYENQTQEPGILRRRQWLLHGIRQDRCVLRWKRDRGVMPGDGGLNVRK